MKNGLKWGLLALLLVGILAGAGVLYNKYSKDFGGNNLVQNTATEAPGQKETEEPSESEAPQETVSEPQESEAPAYQPAPDFTVLDAEGNPVKLSDFKGQPVVVNFWATWCYYCKEEMPDFDKAREAYPDVQFMMVNATDGVQETMETAKAYIAEKGFGFDVFYDTELNAVNSYYVTGFPATFFVDAEGNLIARGNGMLDYDTLVRGIGMITE